MINLIRKTVERVYARYLFWKWDREHLAAEERFLGCLHERTIFVDVGAVHEKCIDCWALRVPKLGAGPFDEVDSTAMMWTPNCADPRKAIQVAPPNTRVS